MTIPKLIDFQHAINQASHFNNNRGCSLQITNQKELISNVPHQFSLVVTSTKAAIKRGALKRAFSYFTCEGWYAVMLEQLTTNSWGDPATEYIFTMNPTYKAHIETNLDEYRYQILLQYIECWKTPAQRKLEAKELFATWYGYDVRNLATQHLKNHLYQKVVGCGSFAGAIMFTFTHFVKMNDSTKTLPAGFTPIIAGVIQDLQGHIHRAIGHDIHVSQYERLDTIIQQNTIL